MDICMLLPQEVNYKIKNDHMDKVHTFVCFVITVLTQTNAPFDYKPPLLFEKYAAEV